MDIFKKKLKTRPELVSRVVLFALVFVGLGSSSVGGAFELMPEFHSVTQSEWSDFDRARDVDSEYASDWLTFQKPLLWDYEFAKSDKYFDLSYGSLSGKTFLAQERLKLHHHLTDNLEFRFSHFKEQDSEVNQLRQVLELVFWSDGGYGLSFYGSPASNKAETDAGIAFLSKSKFGRQTRFFVNWADFDRNNRNPDPDRWVKGHSPFVAGFTYQRINNPEALPRFSALSFRREYPVSLLDPNSEREVKYHNSSFVFKHFRTTKNLNRFEFRAQLDDKSESQVDQSAQAPDGDRWARRRRALAQAELAIFKGPYELKPGLSYQYREYREDQDSAIFRDLLPSFWIAFQKNESEQFKSQWSLGFDASIHSESQPSPLLPTRRASASEGRMNLKYDIKFKNSGELVILGSFDLDRFGSGESWEGGNAQFSLPF